MCTPEVHISESAKDVHIKPDEDQACTPHVHNIRRDVPMQPNERAKIARCAPDECVRMHGLTTKDGAPMCTPEVHITEVGNEQQARIIKVNTAKSPVVTNSSPMY